MIYYYSLPIGYKQRNAIASIQESFSKNVNILQAMYMLWTVYTYGL